MNAMVLPIRRVLFRLGNAFHQQLDPGPSQLSNWKLHRGERRIHKLAGIEVVITNHRQIVRNLQSHLMDRSIDTHGQSVIMYKNGGGLSPGTHHLLDRPVSIHRVSFSALYQIFPGRETIALQEITISGQTLSLESG